MNHGVREETTAQQLQPGDIVYIPKGGKFYVDVILLSTSFEDGTAFIETAELDGYLPYLTAGKPI